MLSRTFMAIAWLPFGDKIDQNSRKLEEELVGKNARGEVFDIGAGAYAIYHVLPHHFIPFCYV